MSTIATGTPPAEGRIARKRRATHARLLEAAYHIMSEEGVDASKIKDITDRAEVGFGTFYNYFASKDQLASGVLDCVINDLGKRNVAATYGMGRNDPALVMPVSIRLVLCAVMADPLWQWWAMRPDLLFDRMREGFEPFGQRDMREAVRRGIFHLKDEQIGTAWRLSIWMMVAGIHDVVVRQEPASIESFVTEGIMRMMGVADGDAHRISSTMLPDYPLPDIDWTFSLHADRKK